jgi:hypothetical protein
MRLLDDLLHDLSHTSESARSEICNIDEAVARMERAFSFQSPSGFDIIQMAAALAGQAPPLPGAPSEFVPREAFVRELAGLVEDAELRQTARQEQVVAQEVCSHCLCRHCVPP